MNLMMALLSTPRILQVTIECKVSATLGGIPMQSNALRDLCQWPIASILATREFGAFLSFSRQIVSRANFGGPFLAMT